MNFQYYKTEEFTDYKPSGKSHFYLPGSPERFTSQEIINIWENKADDDLYKRWSNALSDGERFLMNKQ